jgi:hypothetical protein
MREDGGLTGYGMATAPCDVPALERIHATAGLVMSSSQRR